MKIIVDAGHGGFDNGAIYKDRREKDDNLALSLLLRDKLVEEGIDVFMTRSDDIYNSPSDKADIANKEGGDLFVSIHRNAAYAPNTYEGVQTLVYNKSGSKLRIGESINSELEEIGFNNINVEARPDLAVLRKTKMPAVLVEVGFIDSDYDNMIFDNNFDDIAGAIARGILDIIAPRAVASDNIKVVKEDKENTISIENSTSDEVEKLDWSKLTNQTEKDEMPPSTEEPGKRYKIQLGFFNNYCYAKTLERELCLRGYDTMLDKEQDGYVVYVGYFVGLEKAENELNKLRLQGYDAFIV